MDQKGRQALEIVATIALGDSLLEVGCSARAYREAGSVSSAESIYSLARH